MTEQERAVAEARKAGADEATSAVRRQIFGAEVRAAIAGKVVDPTLFEHPEVAMHLLGLGEVPMTPSGDVDGARIATAVGDFMKERAYLAPSTAPPAPPKPGNGDQGPRQQPAPVDVENMAWDDLRKMVAKR